MEKITKAHENKGVDSAMSIFRMTDAEYDKLNPPFALGEVSSDDEWIYIGHIPTPKTRLGWFVYDIIHGLAMRYRFLPVIVFAFEGLFGRNKCGFTIDSE